MNCNYPESLRFRSKIVQPEIVAEHLKKYTNDYMDITSFIYFITDGEYVKIGSAYNPIKRLNDLQVGNARELKLMFTIPVRRIDKRFQHIDEINRSVQELDYSLRIEMFLHQGFGENHIRGEWFDILHRIEVKKWLSVFGCETKTDSMKKYKKG